MSREILLKTLYIPLIQFYGFNLLIKSPFSLRVSIHITMSIIPCKEKPSSYKKEKYSFLFPYVKITTIIKFLKSTYLL